MKDASAYEDEESNLGKKFWVGQGTLVVKGGCDFSKTTETAVDELDRLKQFALFRLERLEISVCYDLNSQYLLLF